MDPSNKHQVSLRGASAKEISREALLEKVSHERELRNYARRATASAVFIQSVWRRYYVTKKVAEQFQEEWETLMNCHSSLTGTWISNVMLRPFLFFVTRLSTQQQKIRTRDIHCMQKCFKVLLDSLHISDSTKNFCSLAMGTLQERKTWNYQAKKLISLCSFVIAQCDKFHEGGQSIVGLTTLALRLVVVLTDLKGWKSVSDNTRRDAAMAVEDLVWFMGSCNSGLYMSIRRYIIKLDTIVSSQINRTIQTDDQFLITASAMTLALRPFYTSNFAVSSTDLVDNCDAAEQYCLCLLTIPWFLQRLPAVLISALKHQSILSPCFKIFLIRRDTILSKMSKMDQLEGHDSHKEIPLVGWALANIICLATRSDNEFVDSLDHASYVRVVTTLAETFLAKLENVGQKNKTQDLQDNLETFAAGVDAVSREDEIFCAPLTITYMELLRPICQHWHLVKLLETAKMDVSPHAAGNLTDKNKKHVGNLELLDIAYLYSYMLRISSAFNPMAGSLPVLNLLSFTPGFLVILWGELQTSIFPEDGHSADDNFLHSSRSSKNENRILDRRQKQTSKDGTSKLVNALHKFTGKSQAGPNNTDIVSGHQRSAQVDEESSDFWNIEPMRCGPQGIAKDLSCLLHLFCTAYSHLLLVLDDIEFYDKQVPFKLGQQQKIAAMLNTLVYNGLNRETGHQNRALMDSAIICLHLIYERDCRHQFCPPVLWLSPAKSSRPPIAVAARTHELFSVNMRSDEPLAVSSIGSVVTTTPHVYPFEERVEMFREFINMDQVSRKMAGDTAGPGSRSTEIVVRRGHIVEDGFRQLNSLGPRLKSSIHVSFVSECGLPEAGLDYGGLSKEFLTDISKSAFAPEYGLFSQTSTSDRLLVPNGAARYLENGISMFEFLGRVVGKALYEGILLDYAFSHVFVQKLLGRYSFLDELSTLDPELYRNLMYVKHYDGDVKDLCLDFTVTEESFGKRPVFELKPGGKDTSVTNENKMHYVHAMADYKLNRQIFPFSNAFYRGLTDLISPSWLKLFNASEFNQLLSGGKHDFDVDDLRKNTRYSGGYSEGSRAIKLFWEVVEGFEPKERCMLLKFVTSCSRAPLLGFKHLQPSFTIHKVACDSSLWAVIGGQDVERLPSASTCYNTLKLPTYKRSSTLRAKLLYAINSNAGFELS